MFCVHLGQTAERGAGNTKVMGLIPRENPATLALADVLILVHIGLVLLLNMCLL